MKSVYLVTGIRTPFAKAGTELRNVHAAELGRFALSEAISRLGMSPQDFGKVCDEVILGSVGNPPDAANIARVVALRAGLPLSMSAYSVHRNCASAMEALSHAHLKVASGVADVIVAGGTESMSLYPLMYNKEATSFFDKMSRAKTLGEKASLFAKFPVKAFLSPRIGIVEGLTDPFCGLIMGKTAEIIARKFHISREEQDAFALRSHLNAAKSQESGYFKDEVATYPVPPDFKVTMSNDSGPRKTQSLEALAKLKPFFEKKHGTVTVGNACPITDGAVITIVASEEGLKKLGDIAPMARILGVEFAGNEPSEMGLGPIYSTFKLLKKIHLGLKDFDVVEINEAFAAQVLGCVRGFASEKFCQDEFQSPAMGEIDMDKLNVNGGAIAIGHPVGATGARISLTAARELKKRNGRYALASLCIGGGQGGSLALERV